MKKVRMHEEDIRDFERSSIIFEERHIDIYTNEITQDTTKTMMQRNTWKEQKEKELNRDK